MHGERTLSKISKKQDGCAFDHDERWTETTRMSEAGNKRQRHRLLSHDYKPVFKHQNGKSRILTVLVLSEGDIVREARLSHSFDSRFFDKLLSINC